MLKWWQSIIEWFSNRRERQELIGKFNRSAKEAFIMDVVPILLKAEISYGNSSYRHQFSSWLYHGFRIHVLSGRDLTNDEIYNIGITVLSNQALIRTLVSLGFDTLEITNIRGITIRDWKLTALLELQY